MHHTRHRPLNALPILAKPTNQRVHGIKTTKMMQARIHEEEVALWHVWHPWRPIKTSKHHALSAWSSPTTHQVLKVKSPPAPTTCHLRRIARMTHHDTLVKIPPVLVATKTTTTAVTTSLPKEEKDTRDLSNNPNSLEITLKL